MLKEKVAEATQLPAGEVSQVMEALSEIIEQERRRGRRVDWPGKSGEREEWIATGPPPTVPLRRRVRSVTETAVFEAASRLPTASWHGVIISRDDDLTIKELRERFVLFGCRLEDFQTLADAHRKLGRRMEGVDFLIVGMPLDDDEYRDIVYLLKMSETTGALPVVRMVTADWEVSRPSRTRIEPDEYAETLDQALTAVRENAGRWREEKGRFRRLMSVHGPSDLDNLEKTGNLVADFVERIFDDEGESFKVTSACREAIDRAGRIGNRGLRDKFLNVHLIEDTEQMTLAVQDEGEGFDLDAEATWAAARSTTPDGLSMQLILSGADDAAFEEGGHRLVLTKKKRQAAIVR
jgi:hypothetical protein